MNVLLCIAPIEKTKLIAQSDQFKDLRKCDYRGKSKHTKQACWKLHGKPSRGREKRNGRLTRAQENLVELSETPDTLIVGVFQMKIFKS